MATQTATDPVCGMSVDPSTAKHSTEHQGKTYYFCAPGCKKAFESDPAKYLDPAYKPSM
ncbi:MAG: YHS domain-containing protein [Chloroflexi bacterium]|nr:YHS domain-containing protein [Chloroflexota bacterium]